MGTYNVAGDKTPQQVDGVFSFSFDVLFWYMYIFKNPYKEEYSFDNYMYVCMYACKYIYIYITYMIPPLDYLTRGVTTYILYKHKISIY